MQTSNRVRLTALRGFMPFRAAMDARSVGETWRRHLSGRTGVPLWLHVHVPFCPQICAFCQCSTSLLGNEGQLDRYIDWIEGEIDWMARAVEGTRVRVQYIGGGTPSLLSDAHLSRLFSALNAAFVFEEGARRTFEFLPSALRPGTLDLARSFGFNRLSCGVQSQDASTLRGIRRAPDEPALLARVIEGAFAVGYQEANIDLVWGIEPPDVFVQSLLRTLALGSTSVTVHLVIPTRDFPVYASVDDEVRAHQAFRTLERDVGDRVAAAHPEYEWFYRPGSWVLVRKAFRAGPHFRPYHYSDTDRIPIDMLGVGRYAQSRIVGVASYESRSTASRFDPDERSYFGTHVDATIDAALDVVSELVGDARSDLGGVADRLGPAAVDNLRPVLDRLAASGIVRDDGGALRYLVDDRVFTDALAPLLELALSRAKSLGGTAVERGTSSEFEAACGAAVVRVVLESARPDGKYYARVGSVGVSYAQEGSTQPERAEVVALMSRVCAAVTEVLASDPAARPLVIANTLRGRF